VQYFIIGLCQKVLIANTLAPVADLAFTLDLSALSFSDAWFGALAYTLQIYFDFCGYSNMAIGLALAMGFIFPRNFNYPYAALSLTDFWRRWNITLSLWFRDYVYIPLGGSRGTQLVTIRNLLVVFFLTGLWHGASWNFVVWGLFHGVFLLLEKYMAGVSTFHSRIPRVLKNAYVLLIIIIGWVFFRADSLFTKGLVQALKMPNSFNYPFDSLITISRIYAPDSSFRIFSYASLPFLANYLKLEFPVIKDFQSKNNIQVLQVHILPISLLMFLLVLSVALLVGQSLNPFLYFRF
jgi:alginate O-acetyltransferase complex protein AlgI